MKKKTVQTRSPECPVVKSKKQSSSNTSNYKPSRRPSETLPRTTQHRAFPGHFFHPPPLFLMCVCVCVCPTCFTHPTPLPSVLLQCLPLFCLSPGVKILALSNYWLWCHGQRGCGLRVRGVVSSCTHTKKHSSQSRPPNTLHRPGPRESPASSRMASRHLTREGAVRLGGNLSSGWNIIHCWLKNASLTGFSYSY